MPPAIEVFRDAPKKIQGEAVEGQVHQAAVQKHRRDEAPGFAVVDEHVELRAHQQQHFEVVVGQNPADQVKENRGGQKDIGYHGRSFKSLIEPSGFLKLPFFMDAADAKRSLRLPLCHIVLVEERLEDRNLRLPNAQGVGPSGAVPHTRQYYTMPCRFAKRKTPR